MKALFTANAISQGRKEAAEPEPERFLNEILGNLAEAEAEAELGRIPAELRIRADVLEVRWQICALAGQWDACLDIAARLTETLPGSGAAWGNRAFSLRQLGRIGEARDLLLSVAPDFPDDWTIAYHLSCFSCLLGQVAEGERWFQAALNLVPDDDARRRLKIAAAKEPDFEVLVRARASG